MKIRKTRSSRGQYGSLDGRQVRAAKLGPGELDERDKKILEMRANGATLQEIANELKVSKQRAEQLYKRAIKRNTEADKKRDSLRSQGSQISRGDGMIRRDERGRPTRQLDRRKENLESTIEKLKEMGFSQEEINLLMTGDKDTTVDTTTRDVDISNEKRLRSSGRNNSVVGLRSSGFSISLMEKTPPKEWPEPSKTHMVNWANGRPSFNIPYAIAQKKIKDGDLSDRDWKTLLRFYKNFGPENTSGRRGLRSSGDSSTDVAQYANVGARRMAKIILDRVRQDKRNRPAGKRRHFHIIGPGSMGKSTLTKYLEEQGLIPNKTEAAHVDPDFIKIGIEGYNGGSGSERVHRESAHSATHTVNDAQKEGMDIVTEGTGLRLYDYKTTEDNTYEKIFHIPYLPYQEAIRRLKERNAQGGRQLPISQVIAKGDGLYGFITDHLRRGQTQTMYIWDMDVPFGAAPRVIAKIENGVFQSFDDPKFEAWALQHGGRGGGSDISWFRRNFPPK